MTVETVVYERELEIAVSTALEAGAAVRDFYNNASAATYTKGDGSPVTDADLASDKIIRRRIGEAFPGDAILTEEGVDEQSRLTNPRCWIVDPIDGTQQFIDRTGEFDVLIALVVEHRPVVGVLYQPTEDRALCAIAGAGAWVIQHGEKRAVTFRPVPADGRPRLFTSGYFGAPESLPMLERICERARADVPVVSSRGVTTRDLLPDTGQFDALIGVNPDFAPTMAWEWDFAASDLFVHEAGGRYTDLWGRTFKYNKARPRNVGGIVMSVDPATHARLLEAIAPELPTPPNTDI